MLILSVFTSYSLLIWFHITQVIISSAQWTPYYGGPGGTATTIQQPSPLYISQICVKAGEYIDALQVTWNNGSTSPWIGRSIGNSSCYTANPGQCFMSITLRSGLYIDALNFRTSDGHYTPYWGGTGGNVSNYTAAFGQCINSIDVNYGDYIDRIRFYFLNATHTFPTRNPTNNPTINPTINPTLPSFSPSKNPTKSPLPSFSPSRTPTMSPSLDPTAHPSLIPTVHPSLIPSVHPSLVPTVHPTFIPTGYPSNKPSEAPSNKPTKSLGEISVRETTSTQTTLEPQMQRTQADITDMYWIIVIGAVLTICACIGWIMLIFLKKKDKRKQSLNDMIDFSKDIKIGASVTARSVPVKSNSHTASEADSPSSKGTKNYELGNDPKRETFNDTVLTQSGDGPTNEVENELQSKTKSDKAAKDLIELTLNTANIERKDNENSKEEISKATWLDLGDSDSNSDMYVTCETTKGEA